MKLSKEEKIIRAFGNRIRELRKKRGFGMEDFADRAGFSYTQLSRIELGQINTSVVNAVKLAEALGVAVGELFE